MAGAVYGAFVAAAAIFVLVLDGFGVCDIPNIVWSLVFSFALLIWPVVSTSRPSVLPPAPVG